MSYQNDEEEKLSNALQPQFFFGRNVKKIQRLQASNFFGLNVKKKVGAKVLRSGLCKLHHACVWCPTRTLVTMPQQYLANKMTKYTIT
jgi:hypothetical protein